MARSRGLAGPAGLRSPGPPFRAPHHTASAAALVGGGSRRPQPGEVTLAHRGTLFCDELGEFPPRVLDALRQPLEEGTVRIARQGATVTFPAEFLLVACSNPCPCGREPASCRCSDAQRARYARRLSAPLLDRFDLRLAVEGPTSTAAPGELSTTVRARVAEAVRRQEQRFRDHPWRRNSEIAAGALDRFVPLDGSVRSGWQTLCEQRRLNGRGAAAIRRVARTLADLEGVEAIGDVTVAHIQRAADLRETWT